jgi:uncharacterized Fe-S cluster-containing radical SAM superfamily protein
MLIEIGAIPMKEYQRFLAPRFIPFDPLELAKETEKIVSRAGSEGLERKYSGIYSAPVYGGTSTGYSAGCCLRCIYCWGDWSRDYPEKFGYYYSPRAVAQKLFSAAEKGITSPGWERFVGLKVEKLRISGCEPTLARDHLLSVLQIVMDSRFQLFILETNGILLGQDSDYVRKLSEFKRKLYVRISFKAARPNEFTQRTGAKGEFCVLPFNALKSLLDHGIRARAAAMTDPKVMSKDERTLLIKKLDEIDPSARYSETLEEETIDMYETTTARMEASRNPIFAQRLEDMALRAQRKDP